MMTCTFCRIISGEHSAHIVFEDKASMAFLDHRPLQHGHCLLVPKVHYQTLYDLPEDLVGSLFSNVKRIAVAVEEAMGAEGTFVAMNNKVSQSVPHVHVHIVPRRRGDGLKGFFWPRNPYEDEVSAIETREAIKAALGRR